MFFINLIIISYLIEMDFYDCIKVLNYIRKNVNFLFQLYIVYNYFMLKVLINIIIYNYFHLIYQILLN